MPRVLVSVLFVLVVSTIALAQEPVRVLRVKVGAGEKSIMHRHPDAVTIFMTDVNGKFTFPNAPTQDRSRKAGDVLWTPAITHQPENVGDQPFEIILVELKSKVPARSSQKAKPRSAHSAIITSSTDPASAEEVPLANNGRASFNDPS